MSSATLEIVNAIDERIVSFWFDDLPGLDGPLRIAFYGLSFLAYWISRYPWAVSGSNTSPWNVLPFFRGIENSGWLHFEGLGRLHGSWWATVSSATALTYVSHVSWVLTILGLGGHYPPVALAVSSYLLFALACATHGVGHRWYAPVYAFAFLALSSGNSSWSLDAWLTTRFGSSYPFPPPSGRVLLSGLGRKLALMACVSTLFGGGCSKMWRSGLRWMDGRSLAYYTQINTHGRFTGYLPWMKQMLLDYLPISAFLSVKTILFQFSSVVVLVWPPARPLFILIAWGFHIGIWLTMNPQYLPQAICYFLGVRWFWEQPVTAADSYAALAQSGGVAMPAEVVLAARLATLLTLFVAVLCVAHIELWPFTCVPMYSPYRDLRVHSHAYIASLTQARELAADHVRSRHPHVIGWADAWVQLRLVQETDHPQFDPFLPAVLSLDLAPLVCNDALAPPPDAPPGARPSAPFLQRKHLRRGLQNAATTDIHARPAGAPGEEAVRACLWRAALLPSLRVRAAAAVGAAPGCLRGVDIIAATGRPASGLLACVANALPLAAAVDSVLATAAGGAPLVAEMSLDPFRARRAAARDAKAADAVARGHVLTAHSHGGGGSDGSDRSGSDSDAEVAALPSVDVRIDGAALTASIASAGCDACAGAAHANADTGAGVVADEQACRAALLQYRPYLYAFPALAMLPAWTRAARGVSLCITLTLPQERHAVLARVPWRWVAHRAVLGFDATAPALTPEAAAQAAAVGIPMKRVPALPCAPVVPVRAPAAAALLAQALNRGAEAAAFVTAAGDTVVTLGSHGARAAVTFSLRGAQTAVAATPALGLAPASAQPPGKASGGAAAEDGELRCAVFCGRRVACASAGAAAAGDVVAACLDAVARAGLQAHAAATVVLRPEASGQLGVVSVAPHASFPSFCDEMGVAAFQARFCDAFVTSLFPELTLV